MGLNKKWSQQVILSRERYLVKAVKEGNIFNELQWPLFDIGDDVTNKDFSRNGRITNVYCTEAHVKVIVVDGGGRDLSMEPWWSYVVEWEDGEIDHSNRGFNLRED